MSSADIKGKKCPGCGKIVTFIFIGLQETLDPNVNIKLYNCSDCKTTRAI